MTTEKVVAFCGAGVSYESGIPTFRGKNGLWEKYDPYLYAHKDSFDNLFLSDPLRLRDFIVDIYRILLSAQPNYTHYVLAHLENNKQLTGIIAQNIDNLHFEAGNRNIAEIHGNVYMFVCRKCGYKVKKEKKEIKDHIDNLREERKKEDVRKRLLQIGGVCSQCGKHLESGIVFFGQELPLEELEKSYQYIQNASVMLCIGTSAEVYPAAAFPYYAKKRGLKIININPSSTNLDEISDISIRENSVTFFRKTFPDIKEIY